ncbi:MAG: MBL fold metallo-hydrolase [Acetobacter sp.]|nr:MBL fold metallo-hydrolase [Acetobacter sp.]
MKITILGSGAAYGVPMIFNTWGNAEKTNPKNNRTRASILLEIKGKNILIDAGPDFREQINKNNIKNIDSVFITHGHYDHIGGVPELPRATKLLGHSINVYAASETMTELKNSYGYLFKAVTAAEPDSKSLNWKLLPNEGKFTAEGLEFKTFQLPHHFMHSSAFRYQNVAYVTDWQQMPETVKDQLRNLDLLILECNNGTEPADNGHSDLFKVKEVLAEINPRQTVLTHLSIRVDYETLSQKLPENCILAYDGMHIEI